MREQQYHQIKAVLAKLRLDSSARVAFLVDKDGQQIAVHGDVSNLDTTSLASLAAGNVAATSGMAQLIGEKEFPTLSTSVRASASSSCASGRLRPNWRRFLTKSSANPTKRKPSRTHFLPRLRMKI
jgi:hypothetical protein